MGMQIRREEALAMMSIAETSTEGLISYSEFKFICRCIDRHAKEEAEKEAQRRAC